MAKNILITGAAKRIGACCARFLHHQGHNICLHYRSSESSALKLANELNQNRPASACAIQADLQDPNALSRLSEQATKTWNGIDVLINNASAFFPGSVENVTEQHWNELLDANLKAPFFLTQALLPSIRKNQGCIVNIIDIHAERGLKDYPVYSITKAGLATMTRSLAKELAPDIRVNGVAPGAILWPENAMDSNQKQEIINRIALQRTGQAEDIAKAVRFLIDDADYITGQILAVDGGRSLFN